MQLIVIPMNIIKYSAGSIPIIDLESAAENQLFYEALLAAVYCDPFV